MLVLWCMSADILFVEYTWLWFVWLCYILVFEWN